jgi:hypothetical protein
MLTVPHGTPRLAVDRLAVGACKHPLVLLRLGHRLGAVGGRYRCEASGRKLGLTDRMSSGATPMRRVAAALSRPILASE